MSRSPCQLGLRPRASRDVPAGESWAFKTHRSVAQAPPILSISLLGPLKLSPAPGRLPKKALALLAYLAARPDHTASRERLADLLWPGRVDEDARHSLRNCLLELRRNAVISPHLVARSQTCRLVDIETDLERLGQTIAEAPMQAALLSRGGFLDDFHIRSEPFNEWLAEQRAAALRVVSSALEDAVIRTSQAGEKQTAIAIARQLVDLDPLAETGQRLLLQTLLRAGRNIDALRVYRDFAAALDRELGVIPGRQIRALAAMARQRAEDIDGAVELRRTAGGADAR